MGYILLNAIAILAATAGGLGVGALYVAATRSGGRISPWQVALAAVAEFWLAAILAGAVILAPPQAGAWTMAIGSAVVIWIGFVLPTLLVNQSFTGLSFGRNLTGCTHWLAVMVVQAAILQAIGLVKPA